MDLLGDIVHCGERDAWGVDTTLWKHPTADHLSCRVARWPLPRHGDHTWHLYHCGGLGRRRRRRREGNRRREEGGEQEKGGRGARGLGGSRRREGGEQSSLVLCMAITQHKGSDRLELIVRKW